MRKQSCSGLDFGYSLTGMEKYRFTKCPCLKRLSNLFFWAPNLHTKKIYMRNPTFQLVGKRRISSFNCLSRLQDWMISHQSSSRRKSRWPRGYKVPISEWLCPEQVLRCLCWIVEVTAFSGFTLPCIRAFGKFPRYLLWVWLCDLLCSLWHKWKLTKCFALGLPLSCSSMTALR